MRKLMKLQNIQRKRTIFEEISIIVKYAKKHEEQFILVDFNAEFQVRQEDRQIE